MWIGAESGTPVEFPQAIESASKPYIAGGPIGADPQFPQHNDARAQVRFDVGIMGMFAMTA
ncbi:hypothetical protein [Sphingomonas sp. PAMC 26617]|uniref:hypothetical protein n=1 Tax=Sphingomonas sp. PAMC 26617 TaxID=1112216 RepID=UPI0012F497C3|nr:hypothetical protein [Sphingomonas sp. PAMC 26617]